VPLRSIAALFRFLHLSILYLPPPAELNPGAEQKFYLQKLQNEIVIGLQLLYTFILSADIVADFGL
jgi:hypothetical protein